MFDTSVRVIRAPEKMAGVALGTSAEVATTSPNAEKFVLLQRAENRPISLHRTRRAAEEAAMAIHDHLPAQTLVESHTPLVTYAVRAVAPRLPDATAVDALVAAGMAGLRTAAITHAAAGRDGAGFAAFAKRQITAALAGALAGDTATPAMAAPAAARADALSYMESISGDSALLAAAHPAAFGTPPSAPRHQAGHYAAVAAASDFRSSRDIQTAQQPNAAQLRAFGT